MSDLQTQVNAHTGKLIGLAIEATAKDAGIAIDKQNKIEVENQPELRKVLLPAEMNKLQAADNLLTQFMEEEIARVYNRQYQNFFINDFMIAMGIMIPKYFGMLHTSPYDTKSGTAANDYMQFPVKYEGDKLISDKGYYGSVKCPVWEDAIMDIHPSGAISIRAKMKFERQVNAFLAEVEEVLKRTSVIRGSAVRIEVLPFGLMAVPINPKTNKNIVLAEGTERIVTNLVIPGLAERSKTSLLFTGDFGTGKTETAIRVGVEGQQKFNRTFFYLENAGVFGNLIPYIKNYQAATVFVEDIDQVSGGERDSAMNDLLNRVDGQELKGVDVTFIFTTNSPDKIHPAMRRPGRIDQVIHFDYSDVQSIAKIFQIYAEQSGLIIHPETNYLAAADKAPEKLQGAVVAEIARRAVKYSRNLYGGIITTDRFLDAIESMRNHIEFMREDQKKDVSAENLWANLLYLGLKKALPNWANDGEIYDAFDNSPYVGQQA